ncbi:hypothetical protein KY362_00430, partial [Candidatus Woesearchaeota archaeon]|nr:hypothetical protein [Candidatus Woesearchaeota archaeon]
MSAERFYRNLAKLSPGLGIQLQQAGMPESEVDFVKKTLFSSVYMSIGLTLIAALLLSKLGNGMMVLVFFYPVLLMMLFMYFLKLPAVRILRVEREIDKEIVYAGRFLVIELESGIPIYDAFR